MSNPFRVAPSTRDAGPAVPQGGPDRSGYAADDFAAGAGGVATTPQTPPLSVWRHVDSLRMQGALSMAASVQGRTGARCLRAALPAVRDALLEGCSLAAVDEEDATDPDTGETLDERTQRLTGKVWLLLQVIETKADPVGLAHQCVDEQARIASGKPPRHALTWRSNAQPPQLHRLHKAVQLQTEIDRVLKADAACEDDAPAGQATTTSRARDLVEAALKPHLSSAELQALCAGVTATDPVMPDRSAIDPEPTIKAALITAGAVVGLAVEALRTLPAASMEAMARQRLAQLAFPRAAILQIEKQILEEVVRSSYEFRMLNGLCLGLAAGGVLALSADAIVRQAEKILNASTAALDVIAGAHDRRPVREG